ncbi:MAG: hypothetical protein ACR2H4_17495 [Pyrinomonadaceae bacterium]
MAERTLLRDRFGIDTLEAEVAGKQPRIAEEKEQIFEATVQREPPETTPPQQACAAEKDETEATSESTKPGRGIFSSGETNQCLNQAGPIPFTAKRQQAQTTLHTIHPTYRTRVKRLLSYNTRDRFVLRAGFIILVVIPAAVVTASYWPKGKQTSALNASRSLRAEPVLTPNASQDAPAIPLIKTVRAEPAKPPRNAELPVSGDPKTLPLEVPDRKTKGSKNVPTDDTAVEQNISDKPSYRTVVVVLQIAEGHVTEAYIQNPQVGLRAYESTALRMARERRYSKDTNRKETVILKLTERP